MFMGQTYIRQGTLQYKVLKFLIFLEVQVAIFWAKELRFNQNSFPISSFLVTDSRIPQNFCSKFDELARLYSHQITNVRPKFGQIPSHCPTGLIPGKTRTLR
jgi:hypothetical protein